MSWFWNYDYAGRAFGLVPSARVFDGSALRRVLYGATRKHALRRARAYIKAQNNQTN